jgi:hypothetical protein
MVWAPGVATSWSGRISRVSSPVDPLFAGGHSAFSLFAAYLHFSQVTTESSPKGETAMNSCETSPPMSPVSASTGMNFSSARE